MKKKIQLMLTAFLFVFILAGNFANAQVDVVAGGTTTYANLKLAFDAINLGTHTGAITINITGAGTYTDPAAPAILNSTGVGAANYTSVLIRPTADGVSINATTVLGRGVIELNAADNVTIDGDNPNTGGINRNLTIQNLAAATTTYTSVVRIMTSATATFTSADNNTVKNCLITGSAVGRMISTATSTTGSENTTFGIYVGAGAGLTPTAITSVTSNTAPSGSTVNSFLVDNNAVISCARGIVFNGAAATVSTGVTVTNNSVGDQLTTPTPATPPYTSPTSTVYTKGIYLAGTAAVTVTGNAIKNVMSYVATTTSGIELAAAIGTSVTISSNTINNMTSNGTSGAAKGILVSSATGTYTISKNIINNTQEMGTSSGTAGIDATGTVTSATIELNRITTVYNRSTGTWGASGIIFGGTAVTVKNNTVSDVKMDMTGGAAFSTTFGVHGIRCNAGTNHKVYHNSVNLYGSLFGTAAGSILTSAFCIVGTGQTGITVYNNAFMNRLSGGTAGTVAHVGVYLPSAGTSAMNLTINNNAYYCGTDATTQGIGQAGTTASAPTYLTLAALKVYTGTLNVAGTNDNASQGNTATTFAPFTSDTDFHIPAGLASPLESGGVSQVTTGVTTDYDQPTPDVRPGPAGSIYGGASAPDIGADEFDGINNLPPAITYTALGNTTSTSNRNLNGVTITDADGVNNTTFKPRIYYKKSTDPNTVTGWQNQQSTGTYDFLIDNSLIGGVSAGDVIQYFVVAQDLSGTPLVGINSGTFAATPSSVALTAAAFPITGSIRQYTIVGAPLSGDYTIGVALLNRALGKNITMERVVKKVMKEVFVADENTDNVKSTDAPVSTSLSSTKGKMVMKEVEEVSFVPMENGREYTGPLYSKRSDNPGLPVDAGVGVYGTVTAAVNDLNLRGISGAVRFLLLDATYPSETYPIIINDITGASATNTFTLKPNTGVTSSISGASASTAAIKVLSSYATIDGSNTVNGTTRDLTIENTSITAPIAVWFGSTGTTTMNASGIINCNVINGVNTSSAIVLTDGAVTTAGGYFTNFTIQNNNVQKAYIGIYSFYATAAGNGNGCVYRSNTINSTGANSVRLVGIYVQGADGALVTKNDIGNFDGTSAEDDKGVWFATGTVNSTIAANNIHDLVYTGTGGYGGHGSYISSGVTGCNNTVVNNMYANMSGDGWNYTSIPTDNPIGIVITGTQTGVKVYYNSINMYGNTLNQTSSMSMGIYLGAGSVADIRNNSIANSQGLLAATGYGTVGVYAVTDNTQFSTINNNNYYVSPTGSGVAYIGQIAAAGSLNLGAWQTATAQDANSVSGNPQYQTNTNLHVSLATNSILNNNGGLGTGVTDDYDAPNVRSATTPDIGADEFQGTYVVNLTIALEACPSNNITVALYTSGCGLIASQTIAYTGPGAYTVAIPYTTISNATTCWIKVTNENSLVIWSSALSTFTASAVSYNFTTGLSQVFGNTNLINVGGVWSMISGDVNQDDAVDGTDLADIDNDAISGVPGSISGNPTDLNCDGFVDSSDLSYADNNATVGYFGAGPCSPAGFPHSTNTNDSKVNSSK
ncbi:MAG: hypothetical protein IPN57_07855 [Ignavibacteria bacterium]|nr:hypothetical protein [Ignavibacteria bacterium]